MKYGILGAGAVGTALATRLVAAGHAVGLANRRGRESLQGVVDPLGPLATAVSVDAAAAADMVFLAVPWSAVPDTLQGAPNWGGRILVDATNALLMPDYRAADLGGQPSTAVVAAQAPGARVVKALNHIFATALAADPRVGAGRRVLFVSGDDAAARDTVAQLLAGLGFVTLDLGPLAHSPALQEFPNGVLAAHNLVKLD